MGEHHTAHPEPPVGQVLQVWEFGTATNQVLSKYTGQHAFNPKAAICMTCAEIAQDFKMDLRFTTTFILALHHACDYFLVEVMKKTQLAAIHHK